MQLARLSCRGLARSHTPLTFTVSMVVLTFLVTLGDEDKFSIQLSSSRALRPVPSGLVSATSPDGLKKRLEELQREVDELQR